MFIAGGIGLAPLRSVINYVIDNRENYGTVDIVYGSRSADDLVQLKEIQEVWMKTEGINVHLTIEMYNFYDMYIHPLVFTSLILKCFYYLYNI